MHFSNVRSFITVSGLVVRTDTSSTVAGVPMEEISYSAILAAMLFAKNVLKETLGGAKLQKLRSVLIYIYDLK